MSHRKQQVESNLRRAISSVLTGRMSDPRIRGMVSVTGVDVSADLKTANVGISVHPETYQRCTLQGLRHASRHIQSKVSGLVRMRAVPRLVFELDESLKNQADVFAAIDRGIRDDIQIAAQRPPVRDEQSSVSNDLTTPIEGSPA